MRILGKLLYTLTACVWLCSAVGPAMAADRHNTEAGQRNVLNQNGIKRSYMIHIPPQLAKGTEKVPLVLVLHGGGGNATNAESMTGFSAKADKEGFIVAYPEGSSRFKDKLLTWNAGHCCGYALEKRINDVEFINALLDELIRNYPIDTKRIYATGISNGGMMTHRLGIELPDRFAAIAPVVATLFGDESRSGHPVSAIVINGMLDKAVPNEGGPPGGRFSYSWDGTPTRPALDQGGFWAEANGCANIPENRDSSAYTLWQYRCPAGRAVELYLVKDNGHAWPGGKPGTLRGDTPSTSFNATDVIWEFFKAHPK
jgi:polyhydroxybutyrate depolymerase